MAGSSSAHDRLKALTQERDRLNGLIDQLALEIRRSRIVEPGVETRQAKRFRVAKEGKARATCGHSCAGHAELMNPALWSTLPMDVLHLVFARLPMSDIVRLRCLSKQWNWNVTAKESEFRRTCASTKPSTRLLAMFAPKYGATDFKLYDANSKMWHEVNHQAALKSIIMPSLVHLYSTNGGLVCRYLRPYDDSDGEDGGLILVGNPLTTEWKALPRIPCDFRNLGRPRMVQIVLDKETKCYQVIVVGDSAASIGAVIYNSVTGTWSSVHSLTCCFFGYQYEWTDEDHGFVYEAVNRLGPCAFDCRQGELLEVDDPSSPCLGSQSYALVGDRLFVFHEVYEEIGFCISEYQGVVDSTGLDWVKEKVGRWDRDFENPPRSYDFRLLACEGFLLVFANNDNYGTVYKQDLAWLYDMHVGIWRRLTETFHTEYFEQGTMCELQWDAVP